jgi:hypothetical protein
MKTVGNKEWSRPKRDLKFDAVSQLLLQVSLLIETRNQKDYENRLSSVARQLEKLTKHRNKAEAARKFAAALERCQYSDRYVTVEVQGHLIKVEGELDVRKLVEEMIW